MQYAVQHQPEFPRGSADKIAAAVFRIQNGRESAILSADVHFG